MYQYDSLDTRLVRERIAQFRSQVARRIDGSLTEEEFKPLRLMNGLYLQLHAYMLRVAIPYGTLSARQMRALADIADRYDRGYGHFTTRQNIQYNWPKLAQTPDILEALADVEMHAIQTSGNCIRNITSDPLAGVDAEEIEDPRPTAELLRQWSTLHPEFAYLPRKFKIAVTGSEHDRTAVFFHDIGLRIVQGEAEDIGYQVIVGGGQGRTPVIGKILRDFLPKRELLGFLESTLRVYNLHGRRDNKYKARIKILVREIGIDGFRKEVEADYAANGNPHGDLVEPELSRINAQFAPPAYESLNDTLTQVRAHSIGNGHGARASTKANFLRWLERNVSEHKVPGYAAVTVTLKRVGGEPGDATAAQMRLLAELADDYSFSELRITHEQNVVLAHVRVSDLFSVHQRLWDAELGDANHGLVTDIIACPGLDYCSLATARSIPIAQRVAARFADAERQDSIGPLSVKISGCINACGHHHVGHIGILGLEKHGKEYYQLTLGGDATQTPAVGERAGRGFSCEEVIDAVERVVDHYIETRVDGERFLDTLRRTGTEGFKEVLYATNR
jgi:sulfite reductase (NADPH) hemoprotein beta-component